MPEIRSDRERHLFVVVEANRHYLLEVEFRGAARRSPVAARQLARQTRYARDVKARSSTKCKRSVLLHSY